MSEPSYDLNENAQPQVIAALSVVFALALLCLAARFSSRWIQNVAFGWDDLMAVFGTMSLVGFYVCCILLVQAGIGRHTPAVLKEDPDAFTHFFLDLFVSIFFYTTALALAKLSVLLMYRRLFTVATFKKYLYIVGFLVVGWWIGICFATIFSCNPVNGYWDKSINPQCSDLKTFTVAQSIPNIVTDVIILALPMQYVWKLQITTAQKLSLTFVFMLGGLIIAFSSIRLRTLLVLDDPDPFWTDADTLIWTHNEAALALICASLPTLQPLIRKILPRRFFQGSSNRMKGSYRLSAQRQSVQLTGRNNPKAFDGKGFQYLHDDMDGLIPQGSPGQEYKIMKTTSFQVENEAKP